MNNLFYINAVWLLHAVRIPWGLFVDRLDGREFRGERGQCYCVRLCCSHRSYSGVCHQIESRN